MGIATGLADAYSGHSSPVITGVTSFGCGMIGILSGAFAGDYLHDRHKPDSINYGETICGATIYGVAGYAIGSVAGYCIR